MSEGRKPGKTAKKAAEAKAERLERALRDNLKRRKAQAKARGTNKTGENKTGQSEA